MIHGPSPVLAQGAGAGEDTIALWPLFWQSFDLFSVLLIAGSIAAVALIVRIVMDVREERILPAEDVRQMREMARAGRLNDLRTHAERQDHFVARVLHAALTAGTDPTAVRDAAELTASEQIGRWFRKIEPLNVIGNLGPLVGLAGTVWGMILAFTSLGEAGGQAGPADLSLGISKALFHTLLGLCLAIPCLLVFGFYRSRIDRLCTRAMIVSSELVEGVIGKPSK